MPPRYAYWTILIDGKATAFRAHEREELLPTFNQLARKNPNITMRYFARGRLWDNPEQAQWANRNPPDSRPERRNVDWRPGGEHKDPRKRFEPPRQPFRPRDAREGRPEKPQGFPPRDTRGARPEKPQGFRPRDTREGRPEKPQGFRPRESREGRPEKPERFPP